jgi:hypothetical protein
VSKDWLAASILAVSLSALQGPAEAGKNKNGALIVHTNDSYIYSAQTACSTTLADPGTCAAAGTRSEKASGTVVWLLAAFLSGANPGVSGIYFGIDYDDLNLDPGVTFKACGPPGTLDVPDTDWPYAGRGNTVGFGSPVVGDILFPFYVFKIDGGSPGSFFGTAVNPVGGYAAFIDDSAPPITDRCGNFGQVRWYQAGSNSCPVPSLCQITVTSPTTAVTWLHGSLQEITWNSSQCSSEVAIELLLNGNTCATIADAAPNTGHYQWVAQQCLGSSSGYQVRVTDLIGGNGDESNVAFSIPALGCQLAVSEPNGGERLQTGSPFDIVWGSTSCSATVKIELVKNGTTCKTIADGVPNSGTYPWTVDSCGLEECVYKIRITDAVSSHADESDGTFCIRPCTFGLTSPNGGERWSPGTAQTIGWTSSGCGATVKVELVQNGAVCATIAETTENDGSFPWTATPCSGASGYQVRITDAATGLHDDSDAPFCIGCDDLITVPAGLQFTVGQDLAEIAIQGKNAQALKGYTVRLCFDPAVLECQDMTLDGTRGSGASSFVKSCTSGCAEATVTYSTSCPPQIDPGEGAILRVRFRVKPDAPLGPTQIDLTTPSGGWNQLIPCAHPPFAAQLVDGTVEILPERFRRGDDNADGTIDINDPLTCLNYQYGGGQAPPCMDAGDFDDSGRYDLSDCVANLCNQFAGCPNPPAPSGSCGPDPTTQDPLGCDTFVPCGTGAAATPDLDRAASAARGERLRCTPVFSGDTLRIGIDASPEEPVAALQLEISYDAAILRFRRVESGPGDADFFSARFDPSSGKLRVGYVRDLQLMDPLPAGPHRVGEIVFDLRSAIPAEGSRVGIGRAFLVTPRLERLDAGGEELTLFPHPTDEDPGPGGFRLTVPNPFPAGAAIRLVLADAAPVRIDVYGIQGRHLRTLFEGNLPRGNHALLWDGRTDEGGEAASGIYCLRALIGGEKVDRKFVRVR